MADIRLLNKQYSDLMVEHRNYEQDWQDIAYYIIPTNRNIQTRYSPGTSITDRLFDAHAIHNNNLLAASMKGAMTNRSTKWFSMTFEFESLNEDLDVRRWLENARDITLDYLADSNFYAEIHQVFKDTAAFGTGCLYCGEVKDENEVFLGLRFSSFNLGDYAIAENEDGRVDTVFRKVPMTYQNIVRQFGVENCSEKVQKHYKEKPFEKRQIVHAVYPNLDDDSIQQPYLSVYYDHASKHQLRESSYWTFPYLVPRWDKITGEVYGYGPGHTVLPDVRNLNLAIELDFKALAKTIDPPLQVVDDGSVEEIDLTPAAVNWVREIGRSIATIDIRPNLQHTQINLERLKESINRAFYTDQLQLHSGPQMTASEVIARVNEMNRVLGPVLGRLTEELLDPLIVRVFHTLLTNQVIPQPPEIVIAMHEEHGVRAGQYRIRYESPLARAQRSNEMQALNNLLIVLGPMMQFDQSIIDIFNLDQMARSAAESVGVTNEIIRTEREVAKIREARAEMQAAMMQQEALREDAKAAGAAAPFIKEMAGTPLGMGAPKEK